MLASASVVAKTVSMNEDLPARRLGGRTAVDRKFHEALSSVTDDDAVELQSIHVGLLARVQASSAVVTNTLYTEPVSILPVFLGNPKQYLGLLQVDILALVATIPRPLSRLWYDPQGSLRVKLTRVVYKLVCTPQGRRVTLAWRYSERRRQFTVGVLLRLDGCFESFNVVLRLRPAKSFDLELTAGAPETFTRLNCFEAHDS
ncbi:hypothetical protein B0H12DRAFT_1243509 [Mycena haematopus]|nr:hypothetical protein B0H12DRAFT_1243501 [Mycena haematopus]KAJ7205137.1 hypothetical protein B0H12DRAFT_1243509 [Mycena haematopus]